MSAGMVITAANFAQEVEKSDLPVLVDFWAEWCMPCKMLGPVVDDLANAWAGKVKVGKVDVDAEGDLAQRFNIVSIPTLILFKDGEVFRQKVGAIPKRDIEGMLKDL